jgi:hypothetical protein
MMHRSRREDQAYMPQDAAVSQRNESNRRLFPPIGVGGDECYWQPQ